MTEWGSTASAAPSIYVDMDDVLCETALGFIPLIAREFGKDVAFEDIHSFDLVASFGLTDTEEHRLIELMHEAEVLNAFEPIAGAASALSQWIEAGYEVHVVTGRQPNSAEVSRGWLARFEMEHSALVFVDKYGRWDHRPEGVCVLSREEVCQHGFSLYVDDAPEMIAFLAENTEGPVVAFDRPWNAVLPPLSPAAAARVTRCRGWADVMQRFATLP